MAVKRDPLSGKNYEGPVHGGEGKKNLLSVRPYEFTGVYKSGPNPKLTTEKGYTSSRDGAEEKGFDLKGKGYKGPQNWTPTDLGERHPDDLQHS